MTFSIRTDLLYRYYFPISLDIISLDVLSFTKLSLVTCLISPHVMLSPDMLLLVPYPCYDITYHLPPVKLTLDLNYHISENPVPVILYYIYSDLNL